MVLRDISYACMQASPDRAYGARVQSIGRLEENRNIPYDREHLFLGPEMVKKRVGISFKLRGSREGWATGL